MVSMMVSVVVMSRMVDMLVRHRVGGVVGVKIVRLVAMIFVMMFVMSDGKKHVESVTYRCQGNEKSKSFSSLPILSELRK